MLKATVNEKEHMQEDPKFPAGFFQIEHLKTFKTGKLSIKLDETFKPQH